MQEASICKFRKIMSSVATNDNKSNSNAALFKQNLFESTLKGALGNTLTQGKKNNKVHDNSDLSD